MIKKWVHPDAKMTVEDKLDDENIKFLDSISPSHVDEQNDYITIGKMFHRVIVISDYENIVRNGYWVEELFSMNGNVSFSQHVEVIKNTQAYLKSLSRSLAEQRSRMETANEKKAQEAEETYKSLKALMKRVQNTGKVFRNHLLIRVQADTLDELDRVTTQVMTRATSVSIKPTVAIRRQKDAFLSTMNLAENRIKQWTYHDFDSEAISGIFPFSEPELIDEDGNILGINDDTQSIVKLDDKQLYSRMGVIFGFIGSGKSTALFQLIARAIMNGTKVYILDPKGKELMKSLKLLGSTIISIGVSHNQRINPFQINPSQDPEQDSFNKKVEDLMTMFKIIYDDLSVDQVAEANLNNIIIELYQEKGLGHGVNYEKVAREKYPILEELYKRIEGEIENGTKAGQSLENFLSVLRPYVYGARKSLLNGHTNVDLDNKVVAFNLRDIGEDQRLKRLLMYNLTSFIGEEMMKDLTPCDLFIDEAHIMSDHKSTDNPMKKLAYLYKMTRSFNCGIWSATQDPVDFIGRSDDPDQNHGLKILGNAVQHMYMQMQSVQIDQLEESKVAHFSEKQRNYIESEDGRSENAGRAILRVGAQKIKLKIELTQEEWRIWDPNEYEKKFQKSATEEPTYSLLEAK
jgi:hypothetical protein